LCAFALRETPDDCPGRDTSVRGIGRPGASFTTCGGLVCESFLTVRIVFVMTVTAQFQDRSEAGQFLAAKLAHHAGDPSLLVLAMPRGGVPVGYEVARALKAPLDIFLVRKLGVPGYEELTMGAIASGGVKILNDEV